jgi:hypothetical protein
MEKLSYLHLQSENRAESEIALGNGNTSNHQPAATSS